MGSSRIAASRSARLGLTGVGLFSIVSCTGGPSTPAETGEDGGSSDESTDETGAQQELVDGDLEFIHYADQPMVVDVRIRLQVEADLSAPDKVQWSHASDPGIRFHWLSSSGDELEHRFRIRGLAPATAHTVTAQVQIDDKSESVSGDFSTLAPLPGFEYSVPVEGESANPDQYRLFDWSSAGDRPGGIMMVDGAGQTRWYWGRDFSNGEAAVFEGVKLLEDGSILYAQDDHLFIRNELGELTFSMASADNNLPFFHHEAIMLPNGNLMSIGREFASVNYPDEGDLIITGDNVVEFNSEGDLVWSWSCLEHLDTQRRREGFDTEFPPVFDPETGVLAKDWTHANGIFPDEAGETFLFSLRHQDWILNVDHASGDILWTLGEDGDFTLLEGTWFYHQHSPQWQPDGSLLLYDNGLGNPDIGASEWTSRAVRYEIDFDAMTISQVWEDDMTDFKAPAMGDADIMPSGDYLVTDSTLGIDEGAVFFYSRVREINPEASPQMMWSFLTIPGRVIYRAEPFSRIVGERAP